MGSGEVIGAAGEQSRRGASHPANPYFFVWTHHALESNSAADATSVVPHPPQ